MKILEICVCEQERLEKLETTDEFDLVYGQKLNLMKKE